MLRLLPASLGLFLIVAGLPSVVRGADQATVDKLVGYAKEACLTGTDIDLHADVSGNITIRNPLKPGAEGTVNLKRRDAPGAVAYLDEQIRANVDQQIRDCIRPYMLRIFEAILGTSISTSPGAPSGQLLKNPSSAKLIQTISFGNEVFGVYSCTNQKSSSEKQSIICYFVMTRAGGGSYDYDSDALKGWVPELIDDYHIKHICTDLYLINGRGQRQKIINVAKDDSIWVGIEFENDTDDIGQARIYFLGVNRNLEFHVPIKLPER